AAPWRRGRRRGRVRAEVDANPLAEAIEADDTAGRGHEREPLVARPPVPEALFVPAPHRPLEVDPPRGRIRIEVERPERNLDLRAPSGRGAGNARGPDPVPRHVHVVE